MKHTQDNDPHDNVRMDLLDGSYLKSLKDSALLRKDGPQLHLGCLCYWVRGGCPVSGNQSLVCSVFMSPFSMSSARLTP